MRSIRRGGSGARTTAAIGRGPHRRSAATCARCSPESRSRNRGSAAMSGSGCTPASGSAAGDYNGEERVPPRANPGDDGLARDGTRTGPMYPPHGNGGADPWLTVPCAHCGEPVKPGSPGPRRPAAAKPCTTLAPMNGRKDEQRLIKACDLYPRRQQRHPGERRGKLQCGHKPEASRRSAHRVPEPLRWRARPTSANKPTLATRLARCAACSVARVACKARRLAQDRSVDPATGRTGGQCWPNSSMRRWVPEFCQR